MSVLKDPEALLICNDALALIGHSVTIKSLEDIESAEARSCARALPLCMSQALARGQWSFARRDEVITDDYLTTHASYPWKYTYRLPDDVDTIFSLTQLEASSLINTVGYAKDYIRFDLRNIDNERFLVTDAHPPFVLHYQAKDISLQVCSSMFKQGVTYLLASKLAPEFVKSEIGFSFGLKYFDTAYNLLAGAEQQDYQQGAYSQKSVATPSMIQARS